MNQINPKLQDFSKRLIDDAAKENMSFGTKIPVPCLASEKLRPHLAALMGNIGFKALLARALALAIAEVPWLRAVKVKADGTYEGFEELETHVDAEEFSEGCVVLLSHLLGLLIVFIGEDLTLRLVRQAWPKQSYDKFDLNEGGI